MNQASASTRNSAYGSGLIRQLFGGIQVSKVCKKHIKKPAFIYCQCIGCELERNRQEIENLNMEKAEIERQLDELKREVLRNGERDNPKAT